MIVVFYRAAAVGGAGYTALDVSGLNPLYSGFKPPMKGDADVQKRYNAEAPAIRATGNRLYTCTFTSTTTHASLDAAILYLCEQVIAIPDLVDIKIVQGGTTFYFPAAVFTGYDPDEPTGETNIIRYTFLAGTFTTTAP